MTSFDVHQHLWPEQFVSALRRRNRPPCIDGDELILGEGTFEAGLDAHSLGARLGLLDAVGIDEDNVDSAVRVIVEWALAALLVAAVYTCIVDGPRAFARLWTRRKP